LISSQEEFEALKLDMVYIQSENERLIAELEDSNVARKSDVETIDNLLEKLSVIEQENVLFGIANSSLSVEIGDLTGRVGSLTEECEAARAQIESLKGPGDTASQQVSSGIE
jgi:SMC interacting uncharacterized protein involved in chromosome segregation